VLVVVDRAILDIDAVPTSVLLAEERADEVFVVTPALTSRLGWLTDDDAGALRDAEARLVAVLDRMREQGVHAAGTVGDASPLTAIHDALVDFPADEIIITINDHDNAHWQERGLAAKIRDRYRQPLTEVVVHPDRTTSTRRNKHPDPHVARSRPA
jgi:hypothetical protein